MSEDKSHRERIAELARKKREEEQRKNPQGALLSPSEIDAREGELAWKERFPRDVVESLKLELGPYGPYASMFRVETLTGPRQPDLKSRD